MRQFTRGFIGSNASIVADALDSFMTSLNSRVRVVNMAMTSTPSGVELIVIFEEMEDSPYPPKRNSRGKDRDLFSMIRGYEDAERRKAS